MVFVPFTPVVGFVESMPLDHGAHRAVHDHDAFLKKGFEGVLGSLLRHSVFSFRIEAAERVLRENLRNCGLVCGLLRGTAGWLKCDGRDDTELGSFLFATCQPTLDDFEAGVEEHVS